MSKSKQITDISAEEFKMAAKKWRVRMHKLIFYDLEQMTEAEFMELKKDILEFPNNLTQKQKDKLIEAYKKVQSFTYEDLVQEKEKSIEQIREELGYLSLMPVYYAYRSVSLYDSGANIKDIASDLGTCEEVVRMYLQIYNRL